MEGRNDIRQESQMPPDPLPSGFLDWSSLGSPHTRTSPPSAPDIGVEQNGNIQNQLNVQSDIVPRQETIRTGSSTRGYHLSTNWSTSRRPECSCDGRRTQSFEYRS